MEFVKSQKKECMTKDFSLRRTRTRICEATKKTKLNITKLMNDSHQIKAFFFAFWFTDFTFNQFNLLNFTFSQSILGVMYRKRRPDPLTVTADDTASEVSDDSRPLFSSQNQPHSSSYGAIN